MKTITGRLAILLGFLGFLVCLALVGGVWWGTFQITSHVQKVSTQADKSLGQVEESVDRLRKQLVLDADAVEVVRAAAAKAARDGQNPLATKAEVSRLRADLTILIERTDAVREATLPVAQMVDNAANLAEQAGSKARADRLHAIARNGNDAAKELEAVRDRSVSIRKGETTPTAKDLEALAQQTHKALDLLTTGLAGVKEETQILRKELPEAQQTLDKWKFIGAAIATVILLWIGLGQLAIISWGRRRLAARNAPAPQSPTPAR